MALNLRVIDLTRPLDETSSLWPGIPPMVVESTETIERDGSFSRRLTLDEHSGTHFDAPSHFLEGAAHVADVPASQLVRPLHVVDFTHRSKDDPDAELTPNDLKEHEAVHGPMGAGSVVFLRTDWPELSGSEPLRFPGFGIEAATLLAERGVVGLGTDTLGIDAGRATDFPVHRDVTLPRGIWHVENLTNLGAVPSSGAWAVVGVPRVAGASGFPARVLAIVPEGQ
ncbi:MAG: cyclase family protein [Actinomycetia bacterium]|nr:cyclase family protein [Actinomycetes bacterium]